jgi:hypothetical protein
MYACSSRSGSLRGVMARIGVLNRLCPPGLCR